MMLRKLILGAALAAGLWTPVAAAGPVVSLGGGGVVMPAGQTAPFPVKITDVQGLYGFELQLNNQPVARIRLPELRNPRHLACTQAPLSSD